MIDLASCTGKSNQSWTAVQDGSIRLLAHCLGASGTRVYLYSCNSTSGEQWRAGTDGAISRCLNVSGTSVTSSTCGNYATEHWTLRPSGAITVQSSRECLTGPVTVGSALTQSACVEGSLSQQWTLVAAGAIAVELKNPHTGLCATVPSASSPNGTALVLGTCSTALTSTWRVA